MAEGRRPQTAPGAALAAQPGPRVSPQGPPRRALVPAAASADSRRVRRREDASADPRTLASWPPAACGAAAANRGRISSAWDPGDPRRLGCPERPGRAARSPASAEPGVRGSAERDPAPLATGTARDHPRQFVDSFDTRGPGVAHGPGWSRPLRVPALARVVAQSDRDLVQHPGAPG